MLAEAGGLCYLHEPFKPKWDPPYVWTHFDTWFLHVAAAQRGGARAGGGPHAGAAVLAGVGTSARTRACGRLGRDRPVGCGGPGGGCAGGGRW